MGTVSFPLPERSRTLGGSADRDFFRRFCAGICSRRSGRGLQFFRVARAASETNNFDRA